MPAPRSDAEHAATTWFDGPYQWRKACNHHHVYWRNAL
jgi:hypothetical protein